MKYSVQIVVAIVCLFFVACAQDPTSWKERDPNENISVIDDPSDPNFIQTDQKSKDRVRWSGQMSWGVGTRF